MYWLQPRLLCSFVLIYITGLFVILLSTAVIGSLSSPALSLIAPINRCLKPILQSLPPIICQTTLLIALAQIAYSHFPVSAQICPLRSTGLILIQPLRVREVLPDHSNLLYSPLVTSPTVTERMGSYTFSAYMSQFSRLRLSWGHVFLWYSTE